MAEAFFNHLAKGRAVASSAGTQPAGKVNPIVAEVMREAGMDISQRKPKLLTLGMLESADRVITMGCGADKLCPASFVPTEDWELEDPENKPIAQVRQIRDQVKVRVEELIKKGLGKS